MWKFEKFLEILRSPIRITQNGRELGVPSSQVVLYVGGYVYNNNVH